MRVLFAADPTFGPQLFDLLDLVFPGIRGVADRARGLGAAWESVSTPFIRWQDGRPVSHVGVIELSLVLGGQSVTAGSLHAVATHPAYRRRGYFRQVMEEVLADTAPRYATLVLYTEHPEYYTPFGFRVMQEHCFQVRCDAKGGGADGFRQLDLQDPADVALLHRLLEARAPVSHVAGVVRERTAFIVNESHRPLRYAADLDALVCAELAGTRLQLFDVVAPQMPSLAALLQRMPAPVEDVTVYFSPDRLGVEATTVPYVLDHDGPSYLMVRGPFPAEGQPFTLPRPART